MALREAPGSYLKTVIMPAARRIRASDPARYGVEGARKGFSGWVPNGWRMAVTEAWRQNPKPASASTSPQSKAQAAAQRATRAAIAANPVAASASRRFKRDVTRLKADYHNVLASQNIGIARGNGGTKSPLSKKDVKVLSGPRNQAALRAYGNVSMGRGLTSRMNALRVTNGPIESGRGIDDPMRPRTQRFNPFE